MSDTSPEKHDGIHRKVCRAQEGAGSDDGRLAPSMCAPLFLTSAGHGSTAPTHISNMQRASEDGAGAVQLRDIQESSRKPRLGRSEVESKLSSPFSMKLFNEARY